MWIKQLLTIAMLAVASVAIAQIPVEYLAGDKKSTLDMMFFKYVKRQNGENSPILFFDRSRISIDYGMTTSKNLPQFGNTSALSYNHRLLRGWAPVVVVSILNRGVYPKAGVQYAKIKSNMTLFSWIVSETLSKPNIDFFFLGRYTPKINDHINLFTQAELFSVLPTANENSYTFTQRARLGLKLKEFQFGIGIDLTTTGRKSFINTTNTGVFLRYEF